MKKGWPLDHPTRCVDCGEPYGHAMFLWLPDHQWEFLGFKKKDYACDSCILQRINKAHDDGRIHQYCCVVLDAGIADMKYGHLKIPEKILDNAP